MPDALRILQTISCALRPLIDKKYMENVYRQGAERAGMLAERTLQKFMKKIGYVQK